MINIGTPKTVSLWNTPPKGSFLLMIYLPEEEIVELDIAVIGSGDCSFHPLDKLLLCLNIHYIYLKTNVCLHFVSFKIDHRRKFWMCISSNNEKKSCRYPRPFSPCKWSQNPGLNSPLELSYTILFKTLYSSRHCTLLDTKLFKTLYSSPLEFSYTTLSSYLTALLLFFSHKKKRYLRFMRN